ncbi:Cytochrome c oxidase assembly factor 4 -like protein, mitochondrial [Halotydeus destructor]|nr:Cytochrome c oxidase assembly factor 4 -like protein, mitochondrial [Halotydeus destructor]
MANANMPSGGHHYERRAKQSTDGDDDEEDPVERMLKQTGCYDQHYAVQECMFENRDWRKCQDHVKTFKECMAKSQEKSASLKS